MNKMKQITISSVLLLGLGSACATTNPSYQNQKQVQQKVSATYFRVWAGFKLPQLGVGDFFSSLPTFMNDTVSLYSGKGLSNYIVAMPPQDKPEFVPDEFALVAMDTQESYQVARATPEGTRYSARHWELFDQSNSKSAPKFYRYHDAVPASLESTSAYDMIGKDIDWSTGYNLVYVGTRKNSVSKEKFLELLSRHVALAANNLTALGLRGYIVLANDNYEVAFLNWSSKAAHDKAFETKKGKAVAADAEPFMDSLMYVPTQASPHTTRIDYGTAYSTVQQ